MKTTSPPKRDGTRNDAKEESTKKSRIFSAPQLACLGSLLACLALAAPVFAQSPETVHSFRSKYNLILDQYEVVLQRMGSAKGQKLVNDAKQSIQAVTDHQLTAVFAKSGVPDLSEAVKAVENLVSFSRKTKSARADGGPIPLSPEFPGAPPILADCNNIQHDPASTFAFLVAFQISRSVLAAAEFVCLQTVLGENGAVPCVPLAIAADIAQAVFELAHFCGGEEDSAKIEGSFDRLDHIHNDLDSARTAISSIITNANTNTSSIINNANANTSMIVSELHALGCEIVRLLNTPEGQRASAIPACSGQPGFPYHWPAK